MRRKAGWLGVVLAVAALVLAPAASIAGHRVDPGTVPFKLPDSGPVAGDPDEPHFVGNPLEGVAKRFIFTFALGPMGGLGLHSVLVFVVSLPAPGKSME